jgi:hypothetical protein
MMEFLTSNWREVSLQSNLDFLFCYVELKWITPWLMTCYKFSISTHWQGVVSCPGQLRSSLQIHCWTCNQSHMGQVTWFWVHFEVLEIHHSCQHILLHPCGELANSIPHEKLLELFGWFKMSSMRLVMRCMKHIIDFICS